MQNVLVSGGFDPLHSGHIEYLKASKKLGTTLIVALNSDEWLTRKKGQPFMPFDERRAVLESIGVVDEVIAFDDSDDTACNAIFYMMSTSSSKIIFANGGDRTEHNSPEFKVYGDHTRVEFAWHVGGEKANSSSWLLDAWRTQRTFRDWGYWRVLDDKQTTKVKELVINPGCSLSDQKHEHRNEHWYVIAGDINIELEDAEGWRIFRRLSEHSNYVIHSNTWHKVKCISNEPAHIIEIQYGTKCIEEDIQRRD